MPNLKSIKQRIKTVKSTQKITQAMKLVAASKVRKAQTRVLNARPYTQTINHLIKRLVGSLQEIDKKEIPLMQEREIKSVGIIVISSDRGLCGSYNTNIIKRTIKRILELEKQNIEPKLITIGNKANNFFRRTKINIIESFTQLPTVPSVELANLIAANAEIAFCGKAEFLQNNFKPNEKANSSPSVDHVEIIGTDFISMLRNKVYIKSFLPIKLDDKNKEPKSQEASSIMLFEPELNSILNCLLPLYLSNIIYHALLEASCSELASRMNAMSSATTNAKEIIEKLSIVYNKARQASITQELTEIVGGVEALK